jgi:hypothetical protein
MFLPPSEMILTIILLPSPRTHVMGWLLLIFEFSSPEAGASANFIVFGFLVVMLRFSMKKKLRS